MSSSSKVAPPAPPAPPSLGQLCIECVVQLNVLHSFSCVSLRQLCEYLWRHDIYSPLSLPYYLNAWWVYRVGYLPVGLSSFNYYKAVRPSQHHQNVYNTLS